jgi:hypothetical protein
MCPFMLMLVHTQNVSMPANVATLSLRAYEVILMGPWNLVPETARFVGLDLIDTAGILQLSSLVGYNILNQMLLETNR